MVQLVVQLQVGRRVVMMMVVGSGAQMVGALVDACHLFDTLVGVVSSGGRRCHGSRLLLLARRGRRLVLRLEVLLLL